MKVLVACEFSGIVRDAFTALGHDATSCDIIPSERLNGKHMQCDAIEAAYSQHWDLMIAHPPCTHLAVSGAKHFHRSRQSSRKRWRLYAHSCERSTLRALQLKTLLASSARIYVSLTR